MARTQRERSETTTAEHEPPSSSAGSRRAMCEAAMLDARSENPSAVSEHVLGELRTMLEALRA